MTYFEFVFDPGKKMIEFCMSRLGREPTVIGVGRGGNLIQLEFDPALSIGEKNKLLNGLPAWMKALWLVETKEGSLSPEE